MAKHQKKDQQRQWTRLPLRLLGHITSFGTEQELLATELVCHEWKMPSNTLEACWQHQCWTQFTKWKYDRCTWQEMFKEQFQRQFRFQVFLNDCGRVRTLDVERDETIASLFMQASKKMDIPVERFSLCYGIRYLDRQSKQTLGSVGIQAETTIRFHFRPN